MIGLYDPVMRLFMFRLPTAAVAAFVAIAPCGAPSALAQSPAAPESPAPGATPDKGADKAIEDRVLPDDPSAEQQRGEPDDSRSAMDKLYERLKRAGRPEVGQRIAREIEARWHVSGSDTVDLLMARVLAAMKANEAALALDLLDAIIVLKPDYAEAWNKRATIHYGRKNLERSVADLEMVLRLEPRHFSALFGLGTVMKDLGNKKAALAAYRRALDLNPSMQNAEKAVRDLAVEVEGRDL